MVGVVKRLELPLSNVKPAEGALKKLLDVVGIKEDAGSLLEIADA